VKIKELTAVIFDRVVVYKQVGDGEFQDIFKGEKSEIPDNILEMEIRSIGAKSRRVLDIQVKI
jgi:hypothetical protein